MDPQAPYNPERVVSEVEPRVEGPTPKDSHWITIASMAIFVLLSLATVAFLYYQNQQLKTMLASYQTQGSPTPSATADPIANWKTYSDPKGKFSFKYPSNLLTKDLGNGVISFNDTQNKTKFNLSGFESQSPDKYQAYVQDRTKSGGFIDQKTFVDSQNRSWKTDLALGEVFNFTGILYQQGNYYIVDIQSGFGEEVDNGASFRNFANQILSTFKFLEVPTASPTATLKPSSTPLSY